LTPTWNHYTFHPIQWQVWEDPVRFKAVPAGRGSGKTDMAKRKLVASLLFDPLSKFSTDRRYFYAGPTRQQAKRVAWRDIKKLIPESWVASTDDISESELRITTKFGSELWILGLDKPERIEGVQWNGGVLDESCDLRPKIFDLNVVPALSWRRGWCWRIGVPKRSGPSAIEFREFFEAASAGEMPEARGYTWPSSDIVPKELLEYARKTLDPKDYAEQFEAMFQTAGGGIYYCYDDSENVRQCSYDPHMPLIIGSDFNVNPLAWIIGQRRGDTLEWFDEIWLRDATTRDALDVLWGKYGTHQGGFQFFGDATSTSRHTSSSETDYAHIHNDARFKQAGRIVRYPRSNPALKDRYASSNAMFKNADGVRRMAVAPTCVHLRQDLRTRTYKPGTCEAEDRGADMGHIADAMDYAVWMLFPIQFGVEQETGSIYISERAA
jgi:hypothetical protein